MHTVGVKIEGKDGESLILLLNGGIKYNTDTSEYYIEAERVCSSEFDFVIFQEDVSFWEDVQQTKIKVLHEELDEEGNGFGYVSFNRTRSNIDRQKKRKVIQEVLNILKTKGIVAKLQ